MMGEPNPLLNDTVVEILSRQIHDGYEDAQIIPGLLSRVIDEEMWRSRIIERTGEWAEFQAFEDFVKTPPLEGLGTTIDKIKFLVGHDEEASAKLERVLQQVLPASGRVGRPTKDNVRNTHFSNSDTAERALRRLKRDRPDLADRVIAGEITANAAAVEAGFRRRSVSLPLDSMDNLARALKRKLTTEELRELKRLI